MVYLVGAGPGDPGLLTCRALRLLETAEVVLHDALVTEEVLALSPGERVNVGKRSEHHLARQGGIAAMMVTQARQGRRVVRLKGGDPGIFGRGGEEMQSLRAANVPYEVVPGVTSALAASALSGISLTHRKLSGAVTLMTGHAAARTDRGILRYEVLAELDHTLVVLMGLARLPVIADRLLAAGRDPETPVAVVQAASTAGQRTIRGTLRSISAVAEAAGIASPATVIIGPVAALCDELAWRPDRLGPEPYPPGARVHLPQPDDEAADG
ncbi:MAG: uroporphyrinogen-III C-methyltransferase [Myxococcota bacterium]|nr:uroporphyrinogen-III C-methyltransferase [Myxococcota bacterium]